MKKAEIDKYLQIYRKALLEDCIPFWTKHSLDRDCGGFFSCLDRTGKVTSTDKWVWLQGRQAYMYSALCNHIEKRQEWLDIALATLKFLEKYDFTKEGTCHFHLTREGKVVEGPISLFTDTFVMYGMAEYAIAAKDGARLARAKQHYLDTDRRMMDKKSVALYPFVDAHKVTHHSVSMMMIEVGQTIYRADPDPKVRAIIDRSLDRILNHHARWDKRVFLETLGPKLEVLDTPAGRVFNPGHAIETAWFTMHQGLQRKDSDVVRRAADIVEFSMEKCWDPEFGGMISLLTSDGSEPEPPDWFKTVGLDKYAKVWWVHTEGIYATLCAYALTGKESFADWFRKVHDFSFGHFPDTEYGEWFGALKRDGTPIGTDKGDAWKGVFHLPRALMWTIARLKEMLEKA